MRKVVNQSAVVLFALSIGAGCASHTKTVRTQTVQYPAELEGQSAPVAADVEPVSQALGFRSGGFF